MFNIKDFNEYPEMVKKIIENINNEYSCYYLADILDEHAPDDVPDDFDGFNTYPFTDESGKLIGFAYNYSYINPDYPGDYEPTHWTSQTVTVRFEELREILES